ncbi:MAG: F0F1 ATP synthase subunit delta [Bacillota bacterium]
MSDQTIARRYAQALFNISREKNQLDEIDAELKSVVETLHLHPGFKQLVEHKLIGPDKKKEIFHRIFQDSISQLVMNFLFLVLDKRREHYLEQIYRQFEIYANQTRDIVEAEVRTAVQTPPEELQALEEKLVRITGKKVRLAAKVDPALVGGIVVRIGDRIWDGSVTRRLNSLKRQLESVNFVQIGVSDR